MNKQQVKEAIIVEGKDDAANLKRVIDAEIIITHGFGLNQQIAKRICEVARQKGVIIFTDPDFAGKGIRKRLSELLESPEYSVKHAYLSREEADKNGNIGVENASKEDVLTAIMAAKPMLTEIDDIYTYKDIQDFALTGTKASKVKRIAVGKHFRIGYGNAKQLLKQLNRYGIDREELVAFLKTLG